MPAVSFGPLIADCCQVLSSFFQAVWQCRSARPVGAGRGCGEGARAAGKSIASWVVGSWYLMSFSFAINLNAIALLPSLGHDPFRGRETRLMMMSGADASTSAAECGRAATSRMNEIATTTVPAGHGQPGKPGQKLADQGQAAWACPHSKAVPSTQMQWSCGTRRRRRNTGSHVAPRSPAPTACATICESRPAVPPAPP